jgi:prephenate dehydratase
VFTSVSSSSTPFGLAPIENSSIGDVKETMDALRATTLCVRGMTSLKIGHALLGRKGGKRDDSVKKVYSHEQVSRAAGEVEGAAAAKGKGKLIVRFEQGLGQCVGYLARRYPRAEIIPVNSTAKAAQEAAEDEEALAICSIKCAEVYDLEVVDTDIQDGGASELIVLPLSSRDRPS